MKTLEALSASLRRGFVFFTILLGVASGPGLGGAIEDALLRDLAPSMQAVGVDARPGANHPAPSPRPRLVSLDSLDSSGPIPDMEWARKFEDGMWGAMLAVPQRDDVATPPPTAAGAREFEQAWMAVPQHERVFLSFTREDRELAARVQEALRASGYVVFVYLRQGEAEPWQHPDTVGSYFERAGVYLVLDTEHARSSPGVRFEASLLKHRSRARRSDPDATETDKDLSCADLLMGRRTPGGTPPAPPPE